MTQQVFPPGLDTFIPLPGEGEVPPRPTESASLGLGSRTWSLTCLGGGPGGQAEGCLVTVQLASGGITSPTGTKAVEEHPEELELAAGRDPD